MLSMIVGTAKQRIGNAIDEIIKTSRLKMSADYFQTAYFSNYEELRGSKNMLQL
ncbi:hypothetical protein [Neisseria arctica]|uniref:hypothetical protein n=1 Tax=Neisseria arctica TaxID=1470200 RepID=UPI000AC9639E|nr:hypothetical protein [Neisseria arctica]UOO87238.1 hypothetical protein LVJ86_03015 [Neisseria arctica]